MNNWIMPSMLYEKETVGKSMDKDNSESEAILKVDSAADNSPVCSSRSVNLTQFSIVGRNGGTRKRPRGRRTGCWWTATRWSPDNTRSVPWRIGRRLRIEESREEAEDGHAMQIDGVEDRVQVDIELSRGEETDPGQRKWYRAGSTVNTIESDKLAVLTDCGAQDMTISGGRVVQDHEGLEEPTVNVQQEVCPITSDIGKVPRGKDNKFQFIRAFWKERSGESDQGQASGQVEVLDIAGGQAQGKVGQTGGGQD